MSFNVLIILGTISLASNIITLTELKIVKEKLIIDFFISMYDTFVDDRKKVSKEK